MKTNRFWKTALGVVLGLILVFLLLFLILNTENAELTDAARKQASGEFIQLSDGVVHYQLEGPDNGVLIVLVHGFSVPAYIWDPIYVDLLSDGFRVLRFDLYGRGFSDRLEKEHNIELFVNQLSELLSRLEIEDPFHLVGLSMGGPISARYANRAPESVASLTFIAPEVLQVTRKDIFPLNLPGVGEYLMAVVMEPIMLPKMQAADFYEPDKFPGWEKQYREQLQYKGTGQALLSTIRSLVSLKTELEYQNLSQTDIPLLLIWGKEDQTISEEHILVLQEVLPNLEKEIIENAGHLPHYERPGIVSPILINFVKSHQ